MRSLRVAIAGVWLALASAVTAVCAADMADVSGYHADQVTLQAENAPVPFADLTVASSETIRDLAAAAALTSYSSPLLDHRISFGHLTARTWPRPGDESLPDTPDLADPTKPNRLL